MALRSEKDRAKAQQEKFQAILSGLLKDEDNKYCEDCDAKGPRWASWNLGVFLCIRCAGIHRNLGVHISRVKSVNLDSWTPEQVAMMQEMGNSRARAVYEANVQDSFRRPQTDSALEAFIRAKYEQKKYIAKEWVPPKPVIPKEWFEDDKADKKKARSKPTSNISLSSGPPSSQSSSSSLTSTEAKASAKPAASVTAEPKPAQPPVPKPKSSSDDLLGLDTEVPQTQSGGGGQGDDLLADIFGGSQASAATQGGAGQQNLMTTQQNGSAEPSLFEGGSNGSTEGQGEKKSAKDSIMALYGSGGSQQQMFGVPDMKTAEPNGDMMPPNSGVMASTFGMMPPNNYGMSTIDSNQMTPNSGMMTSNMGMVNASSRMNPGMMPSGAGMMTASTGMVGPNPGMYLQMMTPSSGIQPIVSSGFKSQKPEMVSGAATSMGMGMNIGIAAGTNVASKPAIFSSASAISQQPKLPQNTGASQTAGMTQRTGMMTANVGLSTNTRSVSSHMGLMSTTKSQGAGTMSSTTVTNNPFMYPGAEFYQPYAPNMYYYPAAGNCAYHCKTFAFGTLGYLLACGLWRLF